MPWREIRNYLLVIFLTSLMGVLNVQRCKEKTNDHGHLILCEYEKMREALDLMDERLKTIQVVFSKRERAKRRASNKNKNK